MASEKYTFKVIQIPSNVAEVIKKKHLDEEKQQTICFGCQEKSVLVIWDHLKTLNKQSWNNNVDTWHEDCGVIEPLVSGKV